jgi:hypothetical protein
VVSKSTPDAQDTQSSVLFCGCLIRFSHNASQLLIKKLPFSQSQLFTLSLQLSALTFTLIFRHLHWEADFHKVKGREMLGKSHVIYTEPMIKRGTD